MTANCPGRAFKSVMQYNVAQLLKEPTGSSRSYQVEENYSEPLRVTDWVVGTVSMVRTHQGVLTKANLNVQTTVTCSRCLKEFSRPSTLHIEEEFFPTVDLHSGRKLPPLPEEEMESSIDADHVLDLTEMTRQYAIADMPIKPLCKDGCLGLCAVCGNDLNQKQCDCDKTPRDSRWGALAGLLDPEN